jgi:predicted dehydrogenase
MCQMTHAQPIRVAAIGARLTDEIQPEKYNYGQLQVIFDDGSVGWYEAGWGPMMSETAYFVKDVIGPKGSVSIAATKMEKSADIDAHTQTESLLVHHGETDSEGNFILVDEIIDLADEPDHNELCKREQQYLLRSIQEDLDLSAHWHDAVNSLRIVLAADKSIRTGQTVLLNNMGA